MKRYRPNQPRENGVGLLIAVGDGRVAGAILENGFLEHCAALGARTHVLTPGACYKPFVERYRQPGTKFSYISVNDALEIRHRRLVNLEARLGKWLSSRGLWRIRSALWGLLGERFTAADGKPWRPLIEEERPDCFIATDLNGALGGGLPAMCHRAGIPTLGNVFSWDHPYRQQRSRPDRLTCWSPMMKAGLVEMGGFRPEQIDVIGAPVFDPYFDPKGVWDREELCTRLGLDPSQPILLYATLGQVKMFWDETGTFRAFLEALDQEAWAQKPQIVLRLHPRSIEHYFEEFRSRDDVVFSRYTGYCPGMRWWPSREETVLAGNLLRHADVCISPGSTMTVEAAIFDTPTIVPTFNPLIPDEYDALFRRNWIGKHFRFLVAEETVAVANSQDELIYSLRRALKDRSWLSEGRRKIRETVLGPLDGRATERLARAAVSTASMQGRVLEREP